MIQTSFLSWSRTAISLFLLFAVYTPQVVHAGGKVVDVDSLSLAKIIHKHKRLLLVEFYSPSCGHCVKLDPELDRLATHFEGRVTIVKLDSRGGGAINQKYGVRQTPTLILFQNGTEISSARKNLQGYRTFDALAPFLENHIAPQPEPITSVSELDTLVESEGSVVVGLFESPDDPGVSVLKEMWASKRGHVRFALVTDAPLAHVIAESYEVDEIPSVFVLKQLNHTVPYEGAIKEKSLSRFVDMNSFPLVGNFSVYTYYRYKNRPATQLLGFHNLDTKDPEEIQRVEDLRSSMAEVAVEHDDFSFMMVSHKAAEEDGKKLVTKAGHASLQLPQVSIRAVNSTGILALNALAPISPNHIRYGLKHWENSRTVATEFKCMVSKAKDREAHYTPDLIEKYDLLAQEEKSRLGLSDDLIREVDMASFARQMKKSWKDILIIYTARWCEYSTRLEEIFHRMVRAGEFEELEEEVMFVKIDVVLTGADDFKHLQTVPAMKYVSARYKDFPNWYGGPHDDADQLVQFVHSYHSMRFVEIPGEGPSPYSNKKAPPIFDQDESLRHELDQIVF